MGVAALVAEAALAVEQVQFTDLVAPLVVLVVVVAAAALLVVLVVFRQEYLVAAAAPSHDVFVR